MALTVTPVPASRFRQTMGDREVGAFGHAVVDRASAGIATPDSGETKNNASPAVIDHPWA